MPPPAPHEEPDLTDLTEEERRVIRSVMARAQSMEEEPPLLLKSEDDVEKAVQSEQCTLCRSSPGECACVECGARTCRKCSRAIPSGKKHVWMCVPCSEKYPGLKPNSRGPDPAENHSETARNARRRTSDSGLAVEEQQRPRGQEGMRGRSDSLPGQPPRQMAPPQRPQARQDPPPNEGSPQFRGPRPDHPQIQQGPRPQQRPRPDPQQRLPFGPKDQRPPADPTRQPGDMQRPQDLRQPPPAAGMHQQRPQHPTDPRQPTHPGDMPQRPQTDHRQQPHPGGVAPRPQQQHPADPRQPQPGETQRSQNHADPRQIQPTVQRHQRPVDPRQTQPGDTQQRTQHPKDPRQPDSQQKPQHPMDTRQSGALQRSQDPRQSEDIQRAQHTMDPRQSGEIQRAQDPRQSGDIHMSQHPMDPRQLGDLQKSEHPMDPRQAGDMQRAHDPRQSGDVQRPQPMDARQPDAQQKPQHPMDPRQSGDVQKVPPPMDPRQQRPQHPLDPRLPHPADMKRLQNREDLQKAAAQQQQQLHANNNNAARQQQIKARPPPPNDLRTNHDARTEIGQQPMTFQNQELLSQNDLADANKRPPSGDPEFAKTAKTYHPINEPPKPKPQHPIGDPQFPGEGVASEPPFLQQQQHNNVAPPPKRNQRLREPPDQQIVPRPQHPQEPPFSSSPQLLHEAAPLFPQQHHEGGPVRDGFSPSPRTRREIAGNNTNPFRTVGAPTNPFRRESLPDSITGLQHCAVPLQQQRRGSLDERLHQEHRTVEMPKITGSSNKTSEKRAESDNRNCDDSSSSRHHQDEEQRRNAINVGEGGVWGKADFSAPPVPKARTSLPDPAAYSEARNGIPRTIPLTSLSQTLDEGGPPLEKVVPSRMKEEDEDEEGRWRRRDEDEEEEDYFEMIERAIARPQPRDIGKNASSALSKGGGHQKSNPPHQTIGVSAPPSSKQPPPADSSNGVLRHIHLQDDSIKPEYIVRPEDLTPDSRPSPAKHYLEEHKTQPVSYEAFSSMAKQLNNNGGGGAKKEEPPPPRNPPAYYYSQTAAAAGAQDGGGKNSTAAPPLSKPSDPDWSPVSDLSPILDVSPSVEKAEEREHGEEFLRSASSSMPRATSGTISGMLEEFNRALGLPQEGASPVDDSEIKSAVSPLAPPLSPVSLHKEYQEPQKPPTTPRRSHRRLPQPTVEQMQAAVAMAAQTPPPSTTGAILFGLDVKPGVVTSWKSPELNQSFEQVYNTQQQNVVIQTGGGSQTSVPSPAPRNQNRNNNNNNNSHIKNSEPSQPTQEGAPRRLRSGVTPPSRGAAEDIGGPLAADLASPLTPGTPRDKVAGGDSSDTQSEAESVKSVRLRRKLPNLPASSDSSTPSPTRKNLGKGGNGDFFANGTSSSPSACSPRQTPTTAENGRGKSDGGSSPSSSDGKRTTMAGGKVDGGLFSVSPSLDGGKRTNGGKSDGSPFSTSPFLDGKQTVGLAATTGKSDGGGPFSTSPSLDGGKRTAAGLAVGKSDGGGGVSPSTTDGGGVGGSKLPEYMQSLKQQLRDELKAVTEERKVMLEQRRASPQPPPSEDSVSSAVSKSLASHQAQQAALLKQLQAQSPASTSVTKTTQGSILQASSPYRTPQQTPQPPSIQLNQSPVPQQSQQSQSQPLNLSPQPHVAAYHSQLLQYQNQPQVIQYQTQPHTPYKAQVSYYQDPPVSGPYDSGRRTPQPMTPSRIGSNQDLSTYQTVYDLGRKAPQPMTPSRSGISQDFPAYQILNESGRRTPQPMNPSMAGMNQELTMYQTLYDSGRRTPQSMTPSRGGSIQDLSMYHQTTYDPGRRISQPMTPSRAGSSQDLSAYQTICDIGRRTPQPMTPSRAGSTHDLTMYQTIYDSGRRTPQPMTPSRAGSNQDLSMYQTLTDMGRRTPQPMTPSRAGSNQDLTMYQTLYDSGRRTQQPMTPSRAGSNQDLSMYHTLTEMGRRTPQPMTPSRAGSNQDLTMYQTLYDLGRKPSQPMTPSRAVSNQDLYRGGLQDDAGRRTPLGGRYTGRPDDGDITVMTTATTTVVSASEWMGGGRGGRCGAATTMAPSVTVESLRRLQPRMQQQAKKGRRRHTSEIAMPPFAQIEQAAQHYMMRAAAQQQQQQQQQQLQQQYAQCYQKTTPIQPAPQPPTAAFRCVDFPSIESHARATDILLRSRHGGSGGSGPSPKQQENSSDAYFHTLNSEIDRLRRSSENLCRDMYEKQQWTPLDTPQTTERRKRKEKKCRKPRSWHPSPYVSEDEDEQLTREEKKAKIKAEIARRRLQIEENMRLHEQLCKLSTEREGRVTPSPPPEPRQQQLEPRGDDTSSVLKAIDEILRKDLYSGQQQQQQRQEEQQQQHYFHQAGGYVTMPRGHRYGGGSWHENEATEVQHNGGGVYPQEARNGGGDPESAMDESMAAIASTFPTTPDILLSSASAHATPPMPLLPDMPTRSRKLIENLGGKGSSAQSLYNQRADDGEGTLDHRTSDTSSLLRSQRKQQQQQRTPLPTQKYEFPVKRILLTRDPKDRSVSGNGLGMRVVGGKEVPGSNGTVIGAYVAKIFPGGVVETLGEVKEGDQVLEWNGVPLTGRTYEEVQRIIASSADEVEIVIRCDLNMLEVLGGGGRHQQRRSSPGMGGGGGQPPPDAPSSGGGGVSPPSSRGQPPFGKRNSGGGGGNMLMNNNHVIHHAPYNSMIRASSYVQDTGGGLFSGGSQGSVSVFAPGPFSSGDWPELYEHFSADDLLEDEFENRWRHESGGVEQVQLRVCCGPRGAAVVYVPIAPRPTHSLKSAALLLDHRRSYNGACVEEELKEAAPFCDDFLRPPLGKLSLYLNGLLREKTCKQQLECAWGEEGPRGRPRAPSDLPGLRPVFVNDCKKTKTKGEEESDDNNNTSVRVGAMGEPQRSRTTCVASSPESTSTPYHLLPKGCRGSFCVIL